MTSLNPEDIGGHEEWSSRDHQALYAEISKPLRIFCLGPYLQYYSSHAGAGVASQRALLLL